MTKKIVIASLLCLLAAPLTLCAEPADWTTREGYLAKFGGKLEYGALNMLAGWTEIVTTPMEYADNDKSVFAGIAVGFGEALVYTIGGIANFVTSPIPFEIPIPSGGVDLEF